MASFVLLHEATHNDALFGAIEDFAYGWEECRKLGRYEALNNADTYAYFGLLGLLADRQFALRQDQTGLDGTRTLLICTNWQGD